MPPSLLFPLSTERGQVAYYTDEEVAEMEEAAYTAGVDLTPSADGKTWTLAATPAFDVELEVEYETALALSETTNNSAALTAQPAPTMPPTHWTAAASARPHRRVSIFRMVKR